MSRTTKRNRTYKKPIHSRKKLSRRHPSKRHKKRSTRKKASRIRRHYGGNAYGAPANGVSDATIKNPMMAYAGKGGDTNAVNTFVGKPWGSSIQDWPGVSGGAHDGNHYAMNKYDVQPELEQISERTTSNIIRGGRRRKTHRLGGRRRSRSKKGGFGLGLNIFSQLQNDVVNGYNQFTGSPPAASPLPYEDQVFYGNRAQDNLNYLKTKIN